jgi:hypothetical protein
VQEAQRLCHDIVIVDRGRFIAQVLPEMVLLGGMGLVLLLIAARKFRWD